MLVLLLPIAENKPLIGKHNSVGLRILAIHQQEVTMSLAPRPVGKQKDKITIRVQGYCAHTDVGIVGVSGRILLKTVIEI